MIRNLSFYLLVVMLISLPLLVGLGNDMVAKDDYHFKNWSYVFMKEFESGNYDKLYVSVQPGVLTIYSNIIGFKGLYFAKDKLNLISAQGKDFEILLHFAQKLPKVLLIILLGTIITYVLEKLTSRKFAFLFITLLALEPYVIGQSRVIQTDALPMYIGLLALLVFYLYRTQSKKNKLFIVLIGFLVGLCVLEKSLYFILAALISLEILYRAISTKQWKLYIKELCLFNSFVFVTMVSLFPAFWGDFLFTLYRITAGSFIFGIQGYDTETFSYEKTHHIQPALYYLRFLLNKVSEIVWIGVLLCIVMFKKIHKNTTTVNAVLLFLYPITLFIVLLIAEKKIGRYLIAIYPYIILFATVGYYKVLNSKARYFSLIVGILLIKLLQFNYYYPDFIMYQNPLSVDKSFSKIDESWGSGRKKLASYINKNYGDKQTIYAGDHTTLDMFYPGIVLNKDDYKCGDYIDLLITLSANEMLCDIKLSYTDTYNPYNGLMFYIYRSTPKLVK